MTTFDQSAERVRTVFDATDKVLVKFAADALSAVNNLHQTDTTITRYRRRFANSRYGATPAHEDLDLLNYTWRAGVLEQQTVTYSAWETTEEAGTA